MRRDQAPQGSWNMFDAPPHSVPQEMPDRKEGDVTVLYGPRGEPILVRRPVPLGFRPERAR